MNTATMSEADHEIGPAGRFTLHVRSTDVRLRGVDGGTVHIRGRSGEALHGVEVDRGTDQLLVTVRSGRAPDLDIDVPVRAAVTVEGATSDISAHDLHGEQRYRTASGDLRLAGVRGSITAEAVSGDVAIVAGGAASILARTVSGELSILAGALDALRVITTSGDVHVAGRFAGPGPFGIETVSGDAVLAPAGGLRVLATTVTGDSRSDLPSSQEGPRGQRSLVIGEGGATLTFRSMSGDLRVVRAVPLGPAVKAGSLASGAPAGVLAPAINDIERTRLDVLRALEHGDIDIDEAGQRLAALDEHTKTPGDRS